MILYHITTEDRLPNMLKKGLLPNSKPNRSARKAPHIILTKYPAWHLFCNWKKKNANILLEIYLPDTVENKKIYLKYEYDPEGIMWEKPIHRDYIRNVIRFEVVNNALSGKSNTD